MRSFLYSAVISCSMTPLTLGAQPYQASSTSGDWTIYFNEKTSGCFMERQTADGIVMQTGTEAALLGEGSELPFGFLAIYAPESMGKGGEGGETLFMLGADSFAGKVVGEKRDGYRGGYVVANNPNFADDLANQQTMVVFPKTEDPVTIDLTGTKAAMAEVRACMAAHGS